MSYRNKWNEATGGKRVDEMTPEEIREAERRAQEIARRNDKDD